MTDDQSSPEEVATEIVRNRIKEEWKKAWHKAHEESSTPNTTKYTEPIDGYSVPILHSRPDTSTYGELLFPETKLKEQ